EQSGERTRAPRRTTCRRPLGRGGAAPPALAASRSWSRRPSAAGNDPGDAPASQELDGGGFAALRHAEIDPRFGDATARRRTGRVGPDERRAGPRPPAP